MPRLPVRIAAIAASVRYKAQRALRRPALPLSAVAHRSWTLYAGGRFPAIAPVMSREHFDRIICGSEFRGVIPTGDQIRAEISAKEHVFPPLCVHELRDATLLDSNVYAARHKLDLHRQNPRLRWFLGPAAELDAAALSATNVGSRFFGHWLADEAPLQLLAQRLAPPVAHQRPIYPHEPGYRTAFGITNPTRFAAARIRRLLVIDEFAQNPDKIARYAQMRERVAAHPRGHERIYLLRGGKWVQQRRRIINEDDLRARLEHEGFVTIDPEGCSPEELLRRCNGASELISTEGSHSMIAHFFMRPGGRFLTIHPANRVIAWSSMITPFFSLVSGMCICDPMPEGSLDSRADPDEVLRAMDLTNRRAAADAPALEAFQNSLRAAASVITEPRPLALQPAG